MNLKLDHINLTVRDINEGIAWYKDVFDFQFLEGNIKDPNEPWAIVGKDDIAICMYEDKNLKPASETQESPYHRVYHFGIRISDAKAWEEIVKEKKIKVLYGGAYKYPRSVSWYILDPSGHEIEVSFSNNKSLEFKEG